MHTFVALCQSLCQRWPFLALCGGRCFQCCSLSWSVRGHEVLLPVALMPWGMEVDEGARGPKRRADVEPSQSNQERKIPMELKPILKYLVLSSCALLQESRTLQGVLLDCFTIPTKSELFLRLREAGQEYARKCSEAGRGHTLGPPHIHLWHALVSFLAAASEVGAQTRKGMVEHLEKLKTWDQEGMLHVRLVRTSKCFKSKAKKLWISLDEPVLLAEGAKFSLRRMLVQALTQLDGGEAHLGPCPRRARREATQRLPAEVERPVVRKRPAAAQQRDTRRRLL